MSLVCKLLLPTLTWEEVSFLPAVFIVPENISSYLRHEEKGWDQQHWPQMSTFFEGRFHFNP